ncbi:MAG: hypothetical protein LC114_02160 [Bryobacterales bacterium]|nr:hypothetical protein [Bryobacterales bacterium]
MTVRDPEAMERIAALLTYPDDAFEQTLADAVEWAASNEVVDVQRFAADVEGRSAARMQELYIETFDMNPAATLDIGWHLFGEDYARGDLLAKLRAAHRHYGIDERHELPDNLALVLRLILHFSDSDAEAFVREYLAPAVVKIQKGFKQNDNPYLHLLNALLACLGVNPSEVPVYPALPVFKEMQHG